MKVVYKYTLNHGMTQIVLPVNSKILHVKPQQGQLVLYVEVDLDINDTSITIIHVFGTGHTFHNGNLEYINTVMADNGLVWHMYKEIL